MKIKVSFRETVSPPQLVVTAELLPGRVLQHQTPQTFLALLHAKTPDIGVFSDSPGNTVRISPGLSSNRNSVPTTLGKNPSLLLSGSVNYRSVWCRILPGGGNTVVDCSFYDGFYVRGRTSSSSSSNPLVRPVQTQLEKVDANSKTAPYYLFARDDMSFRTAGSASSAGFWLGLGSMAECDQRQNINATNDRNAPNRGEDDNRTFCHLLPFEAECWGKLDRKRVFELGVSVQRLGNFALLVEEIGVYKA